MTLLDHALAVADLYATILGCETTVEATPYPLDGWHIVARGTNVAQVTTYHARGLLTAEQLLALANASEAA